MTNSDTSRETSYDGHLDVGGVVLDRRARLVRANGHACTLPQQEFLLLELLMCNADQVLSADRIHAAIWHPRQERRTNTLAVHVLRLRTKLERRLGSGHHLRTVRGIGYIFDSQPIHSHDRSYRGAPGHEIESNAS